MFAIGGGGDIVSARVLGEVLAGLGIRIVYASTVWERFVHDPVPGPIPLEQISGVEHGLWIGWAKGPCFALRDGRYVEPTACKVAHATRTPIALLDLHRGEVGVRLGLEELASYHGCDTVIAIDVGGDVLAEGCEEELWSPLADALGLSATANSSLDSYLLVFAPGADGELGSDGVVERLRAYRDHYVWSFGLHSSLLGLLKELAELTGTEASRIPLQYFTGNTDTVYIRSGTRRIRLNPLHTVGFVYDAHGVYNGSRLARLLAGTSSIEEARLRLNKHGIYTELDLEHDLYLLARTEGRRVDPALLRRLREEGRKRLNWFTKCR